MVDEVFQRVEEELLVPVAFVDLLDLGAEKVVEFHFEDGLEERGNVGFEEEGLGEVAGADLVEQEFAHNDSSFFDVWG